MILNNFHTDTLDPEKGEYIILCDYGAEGISVRSQAPNLEEAIKQISQSYGGEPTVLVKLVSVDIAETPTDPKEKGE